MKSENCLYLAPMAELSHRALRELIESFYHGSSAARPVYYTEMISAAALLAGGPFEKWYLDGGPCACRLVYQLMGADPQKLAAAAALLDKRECLGIDINMGCAAPAIVKTGAGVRLMENPDAAAALAGTVRRAVTKRLSVKLRLGPKTGRSPDVSGPDLPGFESLLAFCRRLEEAGVDFIALHPRTGGEKFRGRARWNYVTALRGELSVPIAGNGDIDSAEELAALSRSGPVMAGRLPVRAPWAFAEAAGVFLPHGFSGFLEETAESFLDLLARFQPPEFHLSRARRFFRYYCGNFTWGEYLKNRLNNEESLSGMVRVLREYRTARREGER
jgi:tRNA-dihydrouridine synthase